MEDFHPCSYYGNNCEACKNSSFICHFCSFDYQCHAIGSIYGCPRGMTECHNINECSRIEPEVIGYGPTPSVIIGVIGFIIILLCCYCSISFIYKLSCKKSKSKSKTHTKSRYIKKENDKDMEEAKENLLPSIYEEKEYSEDNITESNTPIIHKNQNKSINWKIITKRFLLLSILTGCAIFGLMYFPRIPAYSVCNREFEWESIFQSLRSLHPKVEYQVLLSISNQNRFGFILEKGHADIYHSQNKVGSWQLNQTWEATPGAISDLLATIKIEPDYKDAWSLWTDFISNSLVFQINVNITGYINYGKHKIYRMSSSVKNIEYFLGEKLDRSLCKCKEYLPPSDLLTN